MANGPTDKRLRRFGFIALLILIGLLSAAALAYAAPVIPPGATAPAGHYGPACATCHAYSTPTPPPTDPPSTPGGGTSVGSSDDDSDSIDADDVSEIDDVDDVDEATESETHDAVDVPDDSAHETLEGSHDESSDSSHDALEAAREAAEHAAEHPTAAAAQTSGDSVKRSAVTSEPRHADDSIRRDSDGVN
jgi:hypothetical protein